MWTFVINQKNNVLLSLHVIMIFYSSKLKMKNNIDVSSWLWLHIDFTFVCLSHRTHDCSKWDVIPADGGNPPSWRPPSPFSFLCAPLRAHPTPAFSHEGNGSTRRHTNIPYVLISLPNLPLLPPTYADPWFVFPPVFSPSSLLLGPLLASGRPVYMPLRRLLITTWMQAGKGLLRLGRQQKATHLQFTPAAHPPIPCILGLDVSSVWLRMERGTDVHSHTHVMPVHTFVCMCVQSVYVYASEHMMLHLVIIRIHNNTYERTL